ncbi:MAG: Wzz/FepE/Etk N-terminal domain-containing protein [Anaerolineae bacterium]
MELQRYLDTLKRRALIIIIVTSMTVLVTIAAGILMPPVYKARATVRVLLDVGVLDFNLRVDYGERLLNTYSRILKSGPILEKAIGRLTPQPSSTTVGDLRERVEVEAVPETELITIAVEDKDPVLARDLANILATLLVEHAQNLYEGSSKSARQIVEEQLASMETELESDRLQLATLLASNASNAEVEALRSQIRFKEDSYDRLLDRYELARLNESLRANSITVVEPASLPGTPSNALGLKEAVLGFLIGVFGGLGLALVMENLDTRIHSPQQLEYSMNVPVLATVPRGFLSLAGSGHHTNGTGKTLAEAYRLLSINLQALGQGMSLKTILITSAVPQEGKTTVAANLAQMLAERGQTVFLVESDMRRPTVEKLFGIDNGLGLSGLLTEPAKLSPELLGQIVHPAEQPCLFVIGGGPKLANPTPLLTSPAIDKLFGYLAAQGQTTIVDAPPVLGMADVSILAPKMDGVIVVVRESFTRREQLLAAMKQLQASQAHVFGLVFLQKSSKAWDYQ